MLVDNRCQLAPCNSFVRRFRAGAEIQ